MCVRSKLSFTRQSIQQFCFESTDNFARWVWAVTTRNIIYHRDVFIAIPGWHVDPDNPDLRGATLLWQRYWIMAIFTMMAMHNAFHLTSLHVPVSCLSCLYSQLVWWIQQLFKWQRKWERSRSMQVMLTTRWPRYDIDGQHPLAFRFCLCQAPGSLVVSET